MYDTKCIIIKQMVPWDEYEDDRRLCSQFGSLGDSLEPLKLGPPNVWTSIVYWGICKRSRFIARLGSCTYHHGKEENTQTHKS